MNQAFPKMSIKLEQMQQIINYLTNSIILALLESGMSENADEIAQGVLHSKIATCAQALVPILHNMEAQCSHDKTNINDEDRKDCNNCAITFLVKKYKEEFNV